MSNGGSGTDVVSAADRAVSQPANRALSYGQKAAGQKGHRAQPPPVKGKESGSVVLARKEWQQWYGEDPILSNVTIHDMNDAPSKYVRSEGGSTKPRWEAWTNSSTDVYVHRSLYNPQVEEAEFYVDYVLMHEAYHVVQFRNAGDKPPATFETMLKYEMNAYGLSAVFLRLWDLSKQPAENAAIRKQLHDVNDTQGELFAKHWDRIAQIPDAAMRETECTKFLVLNGNMPPDALKLASPQPFYDQN